MMMAMKNKKTEDCRETAAAAADAAAAAAEKAVELQVSVDLNP